MATIDLTEQPDAASPSPLGILDPLPRRLALTLPELHHVARAAGGAPLPFDVSTAPTHRLEGRLGPSQRSAEDGAYLAAREALHDPVESLLRRGLVGADGAVDPGLIGAVGLLATPQHALEIDVAAHGVQIKAWHRQAGDAVATLSTADGLVFELAWFGVDQWAGELARIAELPEEHEARPSAVPAELVAPFELLDTLGEAIATGRIDLLPVLLAQHPTAVRSGDRVLDQAEATRTLVGMHRETVGRLRVLAARIGAYETRTVGVVSWVLLADGWHALTAAVPPAGEEAVARIAAVAPDELTVELAPVLQEVAR